MCVIGLAAVTLARTAADVATTSDIAVIESDTNVAMHGRLLLGAYSRFQWHHPGPLAFYALAPFYWASGTRAAGLYAGALVVNVASLALIAAVLIHRARPATASVATTLFAVYAWRAADAVVSPWNPHIAVLPFAALLVAAAATLARGPAVLPSVAVTASFAAQAHVGLLPSSFAIAAVAAIGSLTNKGDARRVRTLVFTAAVIAIAWLPPAVEEITAPRGNLTLLWDYFVRSSHAGQPFAVALSAWSDMLTGIIRPDFVVAHGSPFIESPVKWAEAVTLLQLFGLVVVGIDSWRRHNRFEMALAAILTSASLLALWSAMRIDDVPDDHAIYWMVVIGILNLAVIGGTLLDRLWGTFNAASHLRLAQGLAVVALVASADGGVTELRRVVEATHVPGGEKDTVAAVAGDVERYVRGAGLSRPVIRLDQDAWGIGAGVIVTLQKHGVPLAVENDWLVMFTREFAESGAEPAAITIAGTTLHVRLLETPGQETISSRDPIWAHATRLAR